MITVDEAERLISTSTADWTRAEIVALAESPGRILLEDVVADRAYPPFHRVAMDGIAIQHAQWSAGARDFRVEALHKAGDPAIRLLDARNCVEVMTGSALPEGADVVVPYEVITLADGRARLGETEVEAWQNVHLKDGDCLRGACLLPRGSVIDAPRLGIAASVGKAKVSVRAIPRVAIVSTGDELVEVDETPEPHQIRRSNAHALRALLAGFGICGAELFHVKDSDKDRLERLGAVLESHDVLLISGGVSKGKFDFVPGALADLRVKKVFAQVSQRPGKPLWFGLSGSKMVFGLPGNPVSSLVCARRYVVPALQKSLGVEQPQAYAKLSRRVEFTKKLTLFAPVEISLSPSAEVLATPLEHNGSGDFASLRDSDGFVELPLERDVFEAGEAFPLYRWRV